jgi:biopolymer transport protein ExbD
VRIKRKSRARWNIPLASMADIAFLLLIFFMLSSILEIEKEIPIQLPESRIRVSETGKYFNVWVTSGGEYIFDGARNRVKNLQAYARYRLTGNPEIKALISADRNLPYREINAALEQLKEAGVSNVVLVSKKEPRVK